jgi:hypothetical protein
VQGAKLLNTHIMDNQVTNLDQTVHIHASKQNVNELHYLGYNKNHIMYLVDRTSQQFHYPRVRSTDSRAKIPTKGVTCRQTDHIH